MRSTLLLPLLFVALGLQAASAEVTFKELRQQESGNRIGWLEIPDLSDSVLIKIDKQGRVTYLNPKKLDTSLPRGLFFWKSDAADTKAKPIMRISSRNKVGYTWSPEHNFYMKQLGRGKIVRKYKPGSRIHPWHRVETWVRSGGAQKVAGDMLMSPKQKKGSFMTSSSDKAALDATACSATPADGAWTPLHELAYDALINADAQGALRAVQKLKACGQSVSVVIPGDVEHDTLYAIAWEVNDMMDGVLERQPAWVELMNELRP